MLPCWHGNWGLGVLSLILTVQPSGTDASLRGIAAVNDRTAWASGSDGTVLRTGDGGSTWRTFHVASGLDFRGLYAVNESTAWILSSGPGDKSRVYKTVDGGEHWRLLYTNPDAKGFWDAIAFWDATHGIIVGDPVNGRLVLLTSDDGGETWTPRISPAALPGEGAFAASNTCLVVRGKSQAWVGTGASRVFRSEDRGRTWIVTITPIRHDSPSAGIFSLAFSDGLHGVAVGGDYAKPNENEANAAVTADGGRTWSQPAGVRPGGFRSAVIYVAGLGAWIATGTSGSDISVDNGINWKAFDNSAYNALSAASARAIWAVGPKGKIARLGPHE